MNFIVARFLEVLEDEEKVFWLFTMLMEKYLPIDYMIDGIGGALTDQKVFDHLVNYKYNQIMEKLQSLKVDNHLTGRELFKNCVMRWFQSLFTENLPK